MYLIISPIGKQCSQLQYHANMLPSIICTEEPGLNEPLFNENLKITNGILCPSDSNIYEKEPL